MFCRCADTGGINDIFYCYDFWSSRCDVASLFDLSILHVRIRWNAESVEGLLSRQHGGLEWNWIERIAFNTLAPAERSARVCLKVDSQVRAYTVVSHLMLELKSSFTCSDSTLQR